MNVWIKTALALAAVWAVAAGIIYGLHATTPTAASVSSYLAQTDLTRLQGRERARAIEKVADQLNGVSIEERGKIERGGKLRRFFLGLRPDEQQAFLDSTLPAGFKQLMEAFNKMEPEKRRRFVERALEDMKKRGSEGRPSDADPKLHEQVVNQGLRSFYSDASPDVKLDLAPLIEQMQRNLQLGGQG